MLKTVWEKIHHELDDVLHEDGLEARGEAVKGLFSLMKKNAFVSVQLGKPRIENFPSCIGSDIYGEDDNKVEVEVFYS